MRCFSSAVGVNTTTLIRWKRNKLHFSHEEEEWATIQRTDAFFTVYRQTPSHSLKKDFDCFVYFSDSRLSLSYLMLFIFSWGEIYSEFFSLPEQTQYFLMMTQSDKQELIWKPKTKARKITSSHQFPRSALQYQGWHFRLFRKNKSMGGHRDDWFIGKTPESCQIDTHPVWSLWIIQNN